MEFDHGFSVSAPIDTVWATITDIQRVAPCVPNTRVTGRAGPDSFDIEITATIGLFEISAGGNITLTERDDAARREVLKVVATEPDGDNLAEATVTIVLSDNGTGTDGAVHSRVEPGGVATLINEQTLDQVAGNTLRTFAENLEKLLQGGPAAA